MKLRYGSDYDGVKMHVEGVLYETENAVVRTGGA
jgi:hypothetical protein